MPRGALPHQMEAVLPWSLAAQAAQKKEEEDQQAMAEEEDIDFYLVELGLGEGPMRFAKRGERSLEKQLEGLGQAELRCFYNLKRKWNEYEKAFVLSDEMILRFARNSGGKPYKEKAAWKAMKKFNSRFLRLSAKQMHKQLLTKVGFVDPKYGFSVSSLPSVSLSDILPLFALHRLSFRFLDSRPKVAMICSTCGRHVTFLARLRQTP